MSKHQWLSLREVMDDRFRSSRLAKEFMGHALKSQLIVDLGCGNGSNFRYLSHHEKSEAPWLCLDSDHDVLKIAVDQLSGEHMRFEHVDFADDVSKIPSGGEIAMTASALLDITSTSWLDRFASHAARSPLLISMTASGAPVWEPSDDLDDAIGLCLEEYLTSDHGFGPAAGWRAAPYLANHLISLDCEVTLVSSDWHLDSKDEETLPFLIDAISRRASSKLPRHQVKHWAARRQQQFQDGELKLSLPHLDLLSVPR